MLGGQIFFMYYPLGVGGDQKILSDFFENYLNFFIPPRGGGFSRGTDLSKRWGWGIF
jgi:hypothetical protein